MFKTTKGRHAADGYAPDYLQVSIMAATKLMLGEIDRAANEYNSIAETIEHTQAAATYATRLKTLRELAEYID